MVAWLAVLASYAVTAYQFFARVIHPHFLPLVSLLLLGCTAAIVAVGLGLWRILRGPGRLAAMGWLLFAAIPILLWAAHGTYAMSVVRTRNLLMDFRLRLAHMGAAATADGLTRFAYPHRLEGEHTVMIYDECNDPEADLAAMDRHTERVGKVLGRPLPTKVYWVRGGVFGMTGLLQVGGMSVRGMAICGSDCPPQGGGGRPSYTDRHEVAHNVLHDQLPAMAWPPTVLAEGWAESQSGESMQRRAWGLAQGGRPSALSLRQFFSPAEYGHASPEAYYHGGALVDFLLRRYGGEKFFDLCATCRQETIAEDCQRVYGADPDQLDDLFWADVREQTLAARPKLAKSISAELGLPEDGPNDESPRQEFLQRYPKEVDQLREAYRHVRISAIATFDAPQSKDARRISEDVKTELIRDGERVRESEKTGERTVIRVATPQRSFLLAKSPAEARFRTVGLHIAPSARHSSTLAEIQIRTPELAAPYHIMGIDLLERMKSPGFTVTRAVRSQEDSRRLIRVYFHYVVPTDLGLLAKGGWLSLRRTNVGQSRPARFAGNASNPKKSPSRKHWSVRATRAPSATAGRRRASRCSNPWNISSPGTASGCTPRESGSRRSASGRPRTRRSTWLRSTRSHPRRDRRALCQATSPRRTSSCGSRAGCSGRSGFPQRGW